MEKEPKSYGGEKKNKTKQNKNWKILNIILPKISTIFLPSAKIIIIVLFYLFIYFWHLVAARKQPRPPKKLFWHLGAEFQTQTWVSLTTLVLITLKS